MKKQYSSALSFLLIIGLVAYSFYTHKPQTISEDSDTSSQFSTKRALEHVQQIASVPHAVGTPGHNQTREYIAQELDKMGLEVEFQEGLAYTPGWGAMSEAVNIISRIRGSGEGEALILMSHYDSAPHTGSYGASDAGSGVATVLEGIRAFIASDATPINDIIILFTDAEELGLNGASVFVNEHRWAKDAKIALNFEARGSGGPSNMIVETNGGNGALIKAFAKANPSHPYANSLMYSIYKILPNDTDSTVLREGGDIDGFFFAFIGDHFDYHTANDRFERLDSESLEHQGRYLMPLLEYFANTDLNLKSDQDYIYFNFPILKMVYYPFSWIWPMVIVAWVLFIGLIIYANRKRKFTFGQIGFGFIPFVLSLLAAYGVSLLWKGVLVLHPEYADILQGFPYNGYTYLIAFVACMLAVTLGIYQFFYKPNQAASLSIAPLFFWLLIATGVALKLPGAAFFVIPVYFGILAVFLILKKPQINLLWLTVLCAPAIFIVAHYIKEFPVGLGLKMLVAALIFTVLLFGLLLPVIGFYRIRGKLSVLFMLLAIGFFILAESQSSFTSERPFPTSLNYVYDVDKKQAYWTTYNTTVDAWLKNYIGDSLQKASEVMDQTTGIGKYKNSYTYAKKASRKAVSQASIYIATDTVIDNLRTVEFTIFPQREINDILVSNPAGTPFQSLAFNDKEVAKNPDEPFIFSNRNSDKLLSYRVSNRKPLKVNLSIAKEAPLQFTIYDYSYDLIENKDFEVAPRPQNSIPMPFIYTDAIVTKQLLEFSLK